MEFRLDGPIDPPYYEDLREDIISDLAYELNGETRYYEDQWAKIMDEHYPECMVSIAAEKGRISTCCMCAKIEIAEDSKGE